MIQTDDIFLGAYGLVRGGRLVDVEVKALGTRRVAFFRIDGPGADAAEVEYHRGQSLIDLRLLKAEVRRLKDVAFEAIRKEERRDAAGHGGRTFADQGRQPARRSHR